MRLGIVLPAGAEEQWATRCDRLGLASVCVDAKPPGSMLAVAGAVAALTTDVRIAVTFAVGRQHPVALAEQLAVLDNLSGGRMIGVLRSRSDLEADALAEDIDLLRRSLRPGPIHHVGRRWAVPAALEGHDNAHDVEVTPKPVQVQIPLWLDAAVQDAESLGLPCMADTVESVGADALVAPATATITGDMHHDRDDVCRWAEAGVTDLLLHPGSDTSLSYLEEIARFLVPEVAMPHFPRIIAEASLPAAWPGR